MASLSHEQNDEIEAAREAWSVREVEHDREEAKRDLRLCAREQGDGED